MIERSLSVIEGFTGEKPVGWLGPGLTQTEDTPETARGGRSQNIGDWVYDDEPTEIATANGPLVTLPYTVELNDIPMMLVCSTTNRPISRRGASTASTGSTRRGRSAPDHGDRDPPLYQRPAAPHQIPRSGLRPTSPAMPA